MDTWLPTRSFASVVPVARASPAMILRLAQEIASNLDRFVRTAVPVTRLTRQWPWKPPHRPVESPVTSTACSTAGVGAVQVTPPSRETLQPMRISWPQ